MFNNTLQKRTPLLTSHFSADDRDTAAPHGKFGLRLTPLNLEDAPRLSKSKRRHNASLDSSLLEAPIRPQIQQLRKGELGPEICQRREDGPITRKKQKIALSEASISSHSATSGPATEIFEKRPRHKTREDKYEPKRKGKKSRKTGEEEMTRKKREKRGNRKKAVKKAGEDVMQSFKSKSIGQDRLTVSD